MSATHPPQRSAISNPAVPLIGQRLDWLFELSPAGASGGAGLRVCIPDLDSFFGEAEVRLAVMLGPELRYCYVNAAYRGIQPGAPMVGRTYAEVFPEAAQAGAEARLRSVVLDGTVWDVADYATHVPGRDLPIWWQGECVPVDVGGVGRPDGALVCIWDVTRRHVPDIGPEPRSPERTRIEAAKVKLGTRMAFHGLTPARGWRISEQVRETDAGTVWTLRPMHLRESCPYALVEQVEFARPPAH